MCNEIVCVSVKETCIRIIDAKKEVVEKDYPEDRSELLLEVNAFQKDRTGEQCRALQVERRAGTKAGKCGTAPCLVQEALQDMQKIVPCFSTGHGWGVIITGEREGVC